MVNQGLTNVAARQSDELSLSFSLIYYTTITAIMLIAWSFVLMG